MGLPTTSQYSSKASPVSLVSDMGDLTNPARGRGSRNAVTGQSEKKKKESTGVNNLKERKEKKKANELQRTKKDSFLNYKETVIAIHTSF